jgi:hypothetical protein
MIPELAHFDTNPAYGSGKYRRRLRFVSDRNIVVAQVDDTHHSYWIEMQHDGLCVASMDAGFNRAPTNVCPGSARGLQALVGQRLDEPLSVLMAQLPQGSNCTHLADLSLWSIAHVDRSAVWDIVVPDQADSPVWICIERNGTVVHRWQIAGFQLVAPPHFAGNPLMSGFMRWASKAFAGDALLGATMLQRGVFVARGRQHIVDHSPPTPLAQASGMAGMCWSYSEDRLLSGLGSIDYVRDFTACVEPEVSPPHVSRFLKDAAP